ncbi:MAG TPA: MFS transporter [Egibacteraceae bacterium]|nr:MFS transporter [Egibacteraceae bacterium]
MPSPAAPGAPPRGRLSSLAGLGPGYWKLWSASVVSNLGDGTSFVAYPWLASTLTRDPILIAGLGVATRLPWLLFSLPAGAIVDRADRRRLMMWMNAARAALSGAVALSVLTGTMTIPLLYAAALVIGCAEVLYDNAAQTIMPRLVPPDRLERANGNLWGAETVMNQFVGPPLGGVLVAVGLSVPFFVDAGSFALAGGLILLIGGLHRAAPAADSGSPATRRSLVSEMREGFAWLWRHRLLRLLAIMLGAINAAGAMSFAIFVLFVQEILDLGSAGFGLVMTAGAVGAVVGSVIAPSITRRIGAGPSLWATLGLGVLTQAATGSTSAALVAGVMSAGFSFGAVLWNIVTVSLRQQIIPDHLLGRVNSVYRFFGWGMMPIGALAGGAIVAIVEPLAGRDLALRAPFFASSAISLVCLGIALPTLTTARVEAARSASAAAPASR